MHKTSTLSSGIEESLKMIDSSEMSFDYGSLLLDIFTGWFGPRTKETEQEETDDDA